MYRGADVPQHRKRINLPKTTRLIKILDAQVQTDAPTAIIRITSDKGAVGVRIAGATNTVGWAVDLYGGNHYLARVDGFQAEVFTAPLSVVNYLKAKLPPC